MRRFVSWLTKFAPLAALVATLLTGAYSYANEDPQEMPYPYGQDASSVESHLNTLNWDSGQKTIRFFNTRSYGYANDYNVSLSSFWSCYTDYEEKTPLGTRTCIKGRAWIRALRNDDNSTFTKTNLNEREAECGPWQQTENTNANLSERSQEEPTVPEPAANKDNSSSPNKSVNPPTQQQPGPNTSLDKRSIIYLGVTATGFAIASGVIGYFIATRKKQG